MKKDIPILQNETLFQSQERDLVLFLVLPKRKTKVFVNTMYISELPDISRTALFASYLIATVYVIQNYSRDK